ncbi:ubiquitin-protein ligase molybdopterin-converting factor [Mycena pura]|uniref:Ubiquitin-protein ligase molybdopterin-converting factor n=1 Tax=Mycena pura TaxID=153505 RepID=A0AAD6VFY7_9AGAR|nr:ubiquitin-protein ligase molybdopterin-converting factor [Mycena pura]
MNAFDFHSHRTQLVATAIAASAATAALVSAYTAFSRRSRRQDLDKDILRSISSNVSGKSIDGQAKSPQERHRDLPEPRDELVYDEDLIREQLARNYAFFGEVAMAKIRKARVVVVGCGGVGSCAAVMLARSGVSKIRLVDFDYVTLSSLNRHATAALADVGTPKVKCIERALRQIASWVEVDARIDIWRKDDGARLLEGADWVVDAIDNIQTKVDLLKYCYDHQIKVFSSMGAGAKCDPTRVQIADIACTVYDPLARAVRRRLRLQGVASGIPVVYSTEVPSDVKLLPLPEEEFQKGPVKELGLFDDFRVRILPVLGTLPSVFGLHAATYVLCALADKPLANPLPIKNRRKVYERLLRDLQQRESKQAGDGAMISRLPIDEDDVALLFEDVHRGRSVVPPHAVPARPVLVRWDPAAPLALENIVVMDAPEAARHLAAGGGPEVWGAEVRAVVQRRAREIERNREWVM